jgi:hypothetical protein
MSMLGGNTNANKILTGKPYGRRLLRKSKHRWHDNIKVTLKDIGEIAWI